MELGLSLGDHGTSTSTPAAASKLPFGLLSEQDQSRKNNKKITSTSSELGFCMALGIGGHSINHQKSIEINEAAAADDDNTSSSSEEESDEQIRSGDSVDTETPPLQLDLLPLAPVIPSNNTPRTRSLRCSSDNGSSENGSSGNGGLAAARGFDVNRLPAGGDEVSSPNNSMASSFQMDFTIFRGGNTGSNAAALARSGNKRDSAAAVAGGNDAVAGERGSDDDENGLNSSRKKLRLSKEQSAYLEESFKEHNTLNPKQKLALAKQLNLRPRQVEVWFQNRRARTKLKQTEVDCEYLKRCCETLTEENRRLHKELAELRALKTSNPFYMQLPPTTLTMCPSCERTTVATTTTSAPPPTIAIPSSSSPAVAVAVTPATTTSATDDSIPKAIPYPPALPRPRLMYGRPFSHNHNHPPHHSAPS